MFWTVTLSLLSGLGVAVEIFALTLLFALPLGLLIAFGTMSKWAPCGSWARSIPDWQPSGLSVPCSASLSG